jgi:homoserine kinase
VQRRRVVRVPASTANLGPGFDVLAAALALHLELEVEETGAFAVETDLELPRDRSNLVVRAFERLHPADGFTFRIASRIPLAGGLGSSAAAVLAGLLAADHLFELDADVAALATELEGHPDNVAAALAGGVVICAGGRSVRLEPPAGLEALLVVPGAGATTAEARAALPAEVALADRQHEPHRAHLHPRSAEIAARARELGALGATLSGAGPTVLFWTRFEDTAAVHAALSEAAAGWAEVLRVPFEPQGADVREL